MQKNCWCVERLRKCDATHSLANAEKEGETWNINDYLVMAGEEDSI